MDLRDVACDIDTVEVFHLASYMAWPDPALPTNRRIAVVVSGTREFDNAKFLELCASNRSLDMKAFTDYEEAVNWLDASI